MYTTFFGLQQLPFNLTPDPAFLFLPPKHREALAGLTYAILDRKGFVVLTGDAGTGKTTLLNSILHRLPAERIESSVILNPTLSASEFLEGVLLDFGMHDVPASKAQRLWKLQEFLARAHQDGKVVVLVIDEAHKLSLEVLEEIRLLGNFESGADKYLQIMLLGQSELDEVLNRQDLRQLRQRIALRLYIDPLTAVEVPQYVHFRWTKAGGKAAAPFTPEALLSIAEWSKGIPRLVNSICDTTLLMAYGDESPIVGIEYVQAAGTNLAPAETMSEPLAAVLPISRVPHPVVAPSAASRLNTRKPPSDPADPPEAPYDIPTLARYDRSRRNSSLLKRLADKFGIAR
jgi:general secretion pathway protein A